MWRAGPLVPSVIGLVMITERYSKRHSGHDNTYGLTNIDFGTD